MKRILMVLLICILLVLSLNLLGSEYYSPDKIYNNIRMKLKPTMNGTDDDIMKLAIIMAKYQYILNAKPDTFITPQLIRVLPDYNISLSKNRKIIISWNDPSNKTNILHKIIFITEDKLSPNHKITNGWKCKILTGINLYDNKFSSNFGIGIRTPKLWKLSLLSGLTYSYDKNIYGLISINYSLSYGIDALIGIQINFNDMTGLKIGVMMGIAIGLF